MRGNLRYWSLYSIKIEPAAIVAEESAGKRDDSLASDTREYYLSRLDEPYLGSLAEEIGGRYWRAQTPEEFAREVSREKTALSYRTPVNLAGWLGLGALIFLLCGFVKVGTH